MKTTNSILKTIIACAAAVAPASAATLVDISGSFNADTIATSTSDSSGIGYRGGPGTTNGNNEKFLLDNNASFQSANWPASGGTFTALNSTTQYTLGSFTANNTVLLDGADSVTIDFTDQIITSFSALHSAIGLGSATNGTVVFNYTDTSSSSAVTWDLGDSDGSHTSDEVALTANVYRFGTSLTFNQARRIYEGVFVNPEAGKVVTSITFSTVGVNDTDADYGIYAITAVPEPSSLALLGLGGLLMVCHRRRP